MLETGLLAFLNKSAKDYWAAIKAKEHARATAKVKKEKKLKVKRSSAGDRRRPPQIPEGNEVQEQMLQVQDEMLLRDQVIMYLQSRVVLLEQKLVTHKIPLPQEKRHVIHFDKVFKEEWEAQLQELRIRLDEKNEEFSKVSQENEGLKAQLQLASTEASTIEKLRKDEEKRRKKEAEKRKKKSERKAARKAKKEKEEKKAKELKQVEFLQGEWEHSKRGIGSFTVHKKTCFVQGWLRDGTRGEG